MRSHQNFSQQTQPICPHWTLNSCFWAFRTIWVHLGPFGCVTTLSIKRVKQVEKFKTRSRFRIFRNERTDPPHWTLNSCFVVFCTIWVHLVPFGYLTKLSAKTGWSGAKVRAMKSCLNFSQQTTRSIPLDSNLMFRCVSYYLGAFGTVCCVTTLSSNPANLVQKFVPQSRVGIFRNERTRSTPLDSKLMFVCVLYYLDAFATVWLHYIT